MVQAESGRVRTLPVREGSQPGLYDTTAVLERPLGMRLVPSLSLVCRAEVYTLATQVEANVEVHGHSGSAPLSLLNTGERLMMGGGGREGRWVKKEVFRRCLGDGWRR